VEDRAQLVERVAALESQVAALLALVDDQRRRLDAGERPPRAAPPQPPVPAPGDDVGGAGGEVEPVSRRGMIAAAAGIVAGTAVTSVVTATPAAAADLVLGSVSNVAVSPTGLAVNTTGYGIGCTDKGLNALPTSGSGTMFGHTKSADFRAGVFGYAEGANGELGVLGISDTNRAVEAWSVSPGVEPAVFALAGGGFGSTEGTALEGQGLIGLRTWSGPDGTGVLAVTGGSDSRPTRNAKTAVDAQGRGGDSVGVRAMGGRAPLLLLPQGAAPPSRGDAHALGELVVDSTGALWACIAAGSPGTWRKLAGPGTAGALRVLDSPIRTYDSRPGSGPPGVPKGKLLADQQRDIDLKVASAVPAGATAALLNLTVTGTSSGGFLRAFKRGAAAPAASAINWDHAGAAIANNATVACDANARITIRCGGSGASTDFIIDVVGYYL
jgi:hypothetical protein